MAGYQLACSKVNTENWLFSDKDSSILACFAEISEQAEVRSFGDCLAPRLESILDWQYGCQERSILFICVQIGQHWEHPTSNSQCNGICFLTSSLACDSMT